MEGLPVTLIVKAPNQQIEDQTIQCELTWTIRKLKGYLSEVYPCKPKTEEQKLIYSGQLLSDTVVLKDVLRRYEGQDTHTVHLVCATKQNQTPSPSRSPEKTPTTTENPEPSHTQSVSDSQNSETVENQNVNNTNTSRELPTDGVRRRNLNDSGSSQEQSDTPQDPANGFLNNAQNMQYSHAYYWDANQPNPWNNVAYQWGSYNNYPPTGYSPANVPMPPNVDPVTFTAQMAWMQQMQAQYLQFYTHMMRTGGGALPDPQQMYNQHDPNQEADYNYPNNQDVANQPEVQNPQAGNEMDNWDWLDWLYTLSRLMMIFVIVYLYSSPLRFVVVMISGFTLYLYQIGYFQGFLNNNNLENAVNNNINPPQVNNNNAEDNAEVVEENEEANQEVQPEDTEQVNAPVQNVEDQSLLSLTWTIVTSFLTSLLPETPNAI